MKNTVYFILLLFVFFNSCTTKPEIIKLDLEQKYPFTRVADYFVISNPPEDINEIITLVQSNLKVGNQKYQESEYYTQIYYKERFCFTRKYKPHYKWYNPYTFDDIRDGISHLEDRYISIILKNSSDTCLTCPNVPIYILHSKKLKYYPNGFRNNSNKHWAKMKD